MPILLRLWNPGLHYNPTEMLIAIDRSTPWLGLGQEPTLSHHSDPLKSTIFLPLSAQETSSWYQRRLSSFLQPLLSHRRPIQHQFLWFLDAHPWLANMWFKRTLDAQSTGLGVSYLYTQHQLPLFLVIFQEPLYFHEHVGATETYHISRLCGATPWMTFVILCGRVALGLWWWCHYEPHINPSRESMVESSALGLKHPALQSGSTTENGLSCFWSQRPHFVKWE